MFGFLAAALVLQALPVGIVTYTELYANGGLEGVVSAFSYFHFPRAAHYFCAPFLSAVAVTMELALFIGSILGGVCRTGSAQMICLCVASVSAAAAFFMCETLASGVVAIAHFGHCGTWLENRNPWRGHLSSGTYGNPGSSIWESRDFD